MSGQWVDPYTGAGYTVPLDLDIDHLVPLANAHRSGGWMWDTARKRAFANDLDNPKALTAVYKGVNRSKGDRGPDGWLPPSVAYRCTYVRDWLAQKAKWDLTLTAAEAGAIATLRCEGVTP